MTNSKQKGKRETWKPVIGYEGYYEVSDLTETNKTIALKTLKLSHKERTTGDNESEKNKDIMVAKLLTQIQGKYLGRIPKQPKA